MAFPSTTLPERELPPLAPPQMALPPMAPLQIALPPIAPPQMALPPMAPPQMTLPPMVLPQTALPPLPPRQTALPQVALPQMALPPMVLSSTVLPPMALPRDEFRTSAEHVSPTQPRHVGPTITQYVGPTIAQYVGPTIAQHVSPTTAVHLRPTQPRHASHTSARRVGPTSAGRVNPTGVQRVNPTGAQRVNPTGAQRVNPTGAQRVNPTGVQRVNPTGAQRVNPTGAQRIKPTKVLLLLDFQNDFLDEKGKLYVQNAAKFLPQIPRLVEKFRAYGHVVWVRSQYDHPCLSFSPETGHYIISKDVPSGASNDPEEFLGGGVSEKARPCLPGESGSLLYDGLSTAISHGRDTILTKLHYSAFAESSLIWDLRAMLVDEIYLCGPLSNTSVYATARDAATSGMGVTIVTDCVGYRNAECHEKAMHQMTEVLGADTVTCQELLDGTAFKYEVFYSLCSIKGLADLIFFGARRMNKRFSCGYCAKGFAHKDQKTRHELGQHVETEFWSCAKLWSAEAAFYPYKHISCDVCGYCGKQFSTYPRPDWTDRVKHVVDVHSIGKCSKKSFLRDDHRQHFLHDHAGTDGDWMDALLHMCRQSRIATRRRLPALETSRCGPSCACRTWF